MEASVARPGDEVLASKKKGSRSVRNRISGLKNLISGLAAAEVGRREEWQFVVSAVLKNAGVRNMAHLLV